MNASASLIQIANVGSASGYPHGKPHPTKLVDIHGTRGRGVTIFGRSVGESTDLAQIMSLLYKHILLK